jgi:hypothetical protein
MLLLASFEAVGSAEDHSKKEGQDEVRRDAKLGLRPYQLVLAIEAGESIR